MADPGRRGILAILACAVILGAVNYAIAGKQRLLSEGRVVYLRLAPVDPRSLMQGDYMALNYEVAREIRNALPYSADGGADERRFADGRVVVSVSPAGVAEFRRIRDDALAGLHPLGEDEILMRYRLRNGDVKFATNAYFFQEGTSSLYEPARYGVFRVSEDGELLLTGMADENLETLGPD